MRLLLDSSVLLGYLASADPGRTAVAELLRMTVDGRIDLLWTDALRNEVQRTAALRPSVRKRTNDAEVARPLSLVERYAVPVPPSVDPVPQVCRDPGDDFVVAIAVAGRADLVVTLDYDLLALVEHGGVRFVKPGAALTAIRESGDGKGSH